MWRTRVEAGLTNCTTNPPAAYSLPTMYERRPHTAKGRMIRVCSRGGGAGGLRGLLLAQIIRACLYGTGGGPPARASRLDQINLFQNLRGCTASGGYGSARVAANATAAPGSQDRRQPTYIGDLLTSSNGRELLEALGRLEAAEWPERVRGGDMSEERRRDAPRGAPLRFLSLGGLNGRGQYHHLMHALHAQ